MGQKRAAASPIVARRVDNPHTTYAQFVADVAAGKRDAGKQWVAVNLRTVMGGFFRFNGNEAECRACAAYRAAFDAAQLGGAQAVDPGREPVDGGGANPGMVQIAGSDARRKLAMMDAHLGVADVKKLRFVVIGERGPTPYAKHFYGDRSPDGRSVSRAKVEVRRIAAKLSAFINLRTQAGESKGVVSVGERPSDLATYDDEAA